MKKIYAGFLTVVLLAFLCLFAVPNVNAVASANSWETMAEMPTAKSGIGVGVVNGKIYAIGGYNGSTLNTNEMYDPATDTWITKKSMPTSRSFATVVFHNKIYCIDGADGLNEVYDPVTDTWETKQPMPTPRSALSASVVNDKIYLIGGLVPHWTGLPQPESSDVNEMYDPATDSWTTMAPLPSAVAYCVSAVVDDKIYVFGNGDATQIYDTQTNTWSSGPAMPYSVSYGAAAATTGAYAPKRIYRIGGIVYTTDLDSETLPQKPGGPSTQVFDPETGTWSTDAGMPTPRRFLSVAVVDDLLYAIGGKDSANDFSGANERYVPFGYNVVPPVVSVVSPEQNVTYTTGNVSLAFTVDRSAAVLSYSLDGTTNVTVTGNITLTGLTEGVHNVTVYATYPIGNTGASQPIHFTVDFPPSISLLSPQNQTYTSTGVPLTFIVNEPVLWMGYSLDGQDTVAVAGNTTLAGLPAGAHNITVYAKDAAGNIGASDTVYFSKETDLLPIVLVIAVSAAVVGIGLLIYFKKRRH